MAERPPTPIEPGSTGAFRASSASRSVGAAPPAAPILQRALVMPFSPALWRAAADSRARWTIAPLLVLSLVATGSLAILRAVPVKGEILAAADKYEASFDPVVVEEGEVRVEGQRLPRWSDRRSTFLVDPEEVFELDEIPTPEYVVVRRDVIIRKQAFREQRVPVRELMDVLGTNSLVVDGLSIRRFGQRWGLWLGIGLAVLMSLFGLVGDAVAASLYSLVVGGLLMVLRRGLFAGAFRMALATFSIPIVGAFVLHLLKLGLPCCLTLVFWPLVMTAACLLALGDRTRLTP